MKQFLVWTGKFYKKQTLSKSEFESIMNKQAQPILTLAGDMVTGKEFDLE